MEHGNLSEIRAKSEKIERVWSRRAVSAHTPPSSISLNLEWISKSLRFAQGITVDSAPKPKFRSSGSSAEHCDELVVIHSKLESKGQEIGDLVDVRSHGQTAVLNSPSPFLALEREGPLFAHKTVQKTDNARTDSYAAISGFSAHRGFTGPQACSRQLIDINAAALYINVRFLRRALNS